MTGAFGGISRTHAGADCWIALVALGALACGRASAGEEPSPDGSAPPDASSAIDAGGDSTAPSDAGPTDGAAGARDAATSEVGSDAGTCPTGPFGAGNWPPGCWRPYAPTSPWNTPLPPTPKLLSNSAAMVAQILSSGPVEDFTISDDGQGEDGSWPTYYGSDSDPVYTIHCTEYACKTIEGAAIHVPSGALPETCPSSGCDSHLTLVDQAAGWEYDLWHVPQPLGAPGVLSIGTGGRNRLDGSGWCDGSGTCGYSDAAGGAALGGLVRLEELEAGVIPHALRGVVRCDSGAVVYPGVGLGAKCADPTNAPPEGQLLRLAYPDAEIDALNLPAALKPIVVAMAHYGIYVTDTGSNFGFRTESERTYTSFGKADPWADWAHKSGIADYPTWKAYIYKWSQSPIDWTRLQAVDPCVPGKTC